MILKNKRELNNLEIEIRKDFPKITRLEFWKIYYKKKKYRFKKNFKLEDWDNIPYIGKKEIFETGLEARLKDGEKIFKLRPKNFLLQSTSGTSKTTEPIAYFKNVDEMVEGKGHDEGKKMLILYQGRAIALRDTLGMITRNKKNSDNYQSLIINPFAFERSMINAVEEFNPDSIVTFPSCITYLVSLFPKAMKMLSNVRRAYIPGDFISREQLKYTKSKLSYKNAYLDSDYITSDVDSVGICCKYLLTEYGSSAYHPFEDRIIELINVDEYGKGEVVVTKTIPWELSFIKFRTGDIASAVEKKCACGKDWILFLEGRANMDYIKSLGTLIVREEIERVMKKIPQVKDWRGEVREIENKGSIIGELTLYLQLTKKLSIQHLQAEISSNLLLTPKKTLKELAHEKKFMPLKIKLIDNFPPASKKVPLRKIFN